MQLVFPMSIPDATAIVLAHHESMRVYDGYLKMKKDASGCIGGHFKGIRLIIHVALARLI